MCTSEATTPGGRATRETSSSIRCRTPTSWRSGGWRATRSRRALANTENAGAACWARVALSYRRERFAAMDSAFPRYERLTELNEGLAAYVQLRASGRSRRDDPGR